MLTRLSPTPLTKSSRSKDQFRRQDTFSSLILFKKLSKNNLNKELSSTKSRLSKFQSRELFRIDIMRLSILKPLKTEDSKSLFVNRSTSRSQKELDLIERLLKWKVSFNFCWAKQLPKFVRESSTEKLPSMLTRESEKPRLKLQYQSRIGWAKPKTTCLMKPNMLLEEVACLTTLSKIEEQLLINILLVIIPEIFLLLSNPEAQESCLPHQRDHLLLSIRLARAQELELSSQHMNMILRWLKLLLANLRRLTWLKSNLTTIHLQEFYMFAMP